MLDIFSYFVASGDPVADGKRTSQLLWFVDNFPSTEFHGEDRIMYEYAQFSSTLRIPFKADYLAVFCDNELRKFLIKTKIRITGTEDLNYDDPSALETAYKIVTEALKDVIVVWEREPHDPMDFIVSAKSFIHGQLDTRLTETLSSAFNMKSDTEDPAKALTYAQMQLENIRDIYDESILEELDVTTSSVKVTKPEFVSDTGLPGIDRDIDGIYTTQLGGVEAAPGTGKTRFALGVWAYRAAVFFQKNVLYYSLEQSKEECEAMLVSRHIYELYGIQIPDKLIFKDKVPEEYVEQVKSARMDLFESGKYGKIQIEAVDLYMETFIQKIKSIDRLKGPFDLIIIDYMALIAEQNTYGKPKNIGEIVSYCYKSFKKYVRREKKAGIAVNQLNREGIAASKANKEITTEMAQGGIEVYRSTDFNLTISATAEMELQNKRKISQPKKRSSEGMGSLMVDVRLGISLWYQQAKKQI